MHYFDLERRNVMKSLACLQMVKRKTVCIEQKYFLFYLFYFIKVYTDFISWDKGSSLSLCHYLSPWLSHNATTNTALQKKTKMQILDYIFSLFSVQRAESTAAAEDSQLLHRLTTHRHTPHTHTHHFLQMDVSASGLLLSDLYTLSM